MNKQEWTALIMLIALLLLWGPVYQKFFAPPPPPPGTEMPADQDADQEVVQQSTTPPSLKTAPTDVPADVEEPRAEQWDIAQEDLPEEEIVILRNGRLQVELSSRGASLKSAELFNYRQAQEEGSDPVILSFEPYRALALSGIKGLAADSAFSVTAGDDGHTAEFLAQAGDIVMKRVVTLGENYVLSIADTFSNQGSETIEMPRHAVQVGSMTNLVGDTVQKGVASLGVDALIGEGKGVEHYGKKIPKWLGDAQGLPVNVENETYTDWLAVKNKYFVQIYTPKTAPADQFSIQAVSGEHKKEVRAVAASASFPSQRIAPGEQVTKEMTLYVGPKKYEIIKSFGLHQGDVMEFGMWRAISNILLGVMNWIHDHIWPNNYGLAIMLLTIIVRVSFWPLTHRGTESMKRLAELQPQMQEIREKYKDKPQKQQEAMMALYKENKVNPLGGCLPIIIQIPVFFALFVVLRSAIELRFADFLWIHDLSQPENLFADVLPLPLNILPLLMAVTMVWQQRLTPQTGDPKQQKMMATIMPIMMLFLFYTFASGLVLYWTTNQCLMIVQLYIQKYKREHKHAE